MSVHENNNNKAGQPEAVTEPPAVSEPACSVNIQERECLITLITINNGVEICKKNLITHECLIPY